MSTAAPRCRYRIDADDIVVFVSDEWLRFAEQNDAATLDRPEDAIEALGLFQADAMPSISHGMCRGCRDAVIEKIEQGTDEV